MPARVRQAPPEVRYWILTGRTSRSAWLFVQGTARSTTNRRIIVSCLRKRLARVSPSAASGPARAILGRSLFRQGKFRQAQAPFTQASGT
jgi:hypothetical protein